MYQVVVIGASAGGLHALATILARLPRQFPIPLAIVQHMDPSRTSSIAEILGRKTPLRVKEATASETMRSGVAYIAPPGRHLLVDFGCSVLLTDSQPVHFVRPSADVLFESAARICAADVIGVVLTGSGSDGASGATAIKCVGGIVIAQDEETSLFFSMPHAAIAAGAVDYVLPLEAIANRLIELTENGAHERRG
ncbi:MAG TPA: chemotaxis protein CheB [Vicinamibacterales bacterium]|jgi:two-component system chemotaxis response regulator CheB